MVIAIGLEQPIEIKCFPDRHFWHAGYGKASRRSVNASRSPRDRPEREIFSGADTPGKIGARQARRNLTLLHTCPAFCPSYRFCGRLEVKFLRPTRRLGTPQGWRGTHRYLMK